MADLSLSLAQRQQVMKYISSIVGSPLDTMVLHVSYKESCTSVLSGTIPNVSQGILYLQAAMLDTLNSRTSSNDKEGA